MDSGIFYQGKLRGHARHKKTYSVRDLTFLIKGLALDYMKKKKQRNAKEQIANVIYGFNISAVRLTD
jgi:hypothetical protein